MNKTNSSFNLKPILCKASFHLSEAPPPLTSTPVRSVGSYVMMMPFKRQALVEFDSVESAERCVACGTREAVCIADQQAFFNFSTSQRITRPTNTDDPTSGNKVLLLSIQNPLYPITTVSPAEPPPPLCSCISFTFVGTETSSTSADPPRTFFTYFI